MKKRVIAAILAGLMFPHLQDAAAERVPPRRMARLQKAEKKRDPE